MVVVGLGVELVSGQVSHLGCLLYYYKLNASTLVIESILVIELEGFQQYLK
jgi:hypothetical protein